MIFKAVFLQLSSLCLRIVQARGQPKLYQPPLFILALARPFRRLTFALEAALPAEVTI